MNERDTNMHAWWNKVAENIGLSVQDVCGGDTFDAMCEATHSDLPTVDHISQDGWRCQVSTTPTEMRAHSNVLLFLLWFFWPAFTLKVHRRYHLAKTMFRASHEHPACWPLKGRQFYIVPACSIDRRIYFAPHIGWAVLALQHKHSL